MNVKVVVIVVFVAVLVLLGAPLILGVASGNLGQPGAKGQADAEWTDTKLAGTQWGATLSQALPEIPGLGGGRWHGDGRCGPQLQFRRHLYACAECHFQ